MLLFIYLTIALQSGLAKGTLEHARTKGKKGSGSFKVVEVKSKKAKVVKEGQSAKSSPWPRWRARPP